MFRIASVIKSKINLHLPEYFQDAVIKPSTVGSFNESLIAKGASDEVRAKFWKTVTPMRKYEKGNGRLRRLTFKDEAAGVAYEVSGLKMKDQPGTHIFLLRIEKM
jgi:hypothetical protein